MYKIFGHYISKTIFILGLLETLILFASISLAIGITFQKVYLDPVVQLPSSRIYLDAVLFIAVMQAAMISMGLYHRDLRDGPRKVVFRIVLSFILGIAILKVLDILLQMEVLTMYVQTLALSCAFLGIISSRLILYRRTDNLLKRRTLVLGIGEKAQKLERLRRRTDNSGVEIVGYVDISRNGTRYLSEDKIITLDCPLPEYIRKNDIREIIIALDDRRNSAPIEELLECKMAGINIIDITSYLERQLGKINLDTFHPSSFVFSDGFLQSIKANYKRVLDIFISAFILLITLPVMLLTAIAILIECRGKGSIIYRQERIGMNGKSFNLLKFRSMCEDAEKDGVAVWASHNDNRITRVGGFIRKTRIDELPQLINVLRGDMSLVGPRPERPQLASELAEKIPFYKLRHHVKPGITGWAQICYPYGSNIRDAKEKLQYDLYYLKNYSIFLDIVIVVQTITVILWGKGAR